MAATSPIKTLLRMFLVAHGLFNISQGAFSALQPAAFAAKAGPIFQGASDKVIQSIGLGSIGVGVYSTAGALANDRRFFALTALLRLGFVLFFVTQWDWEASRGVVTYEGIIAATSATAAVTR